MYQIKSVVSFTSFFVILGEQKIMLFSTFPQGQRYLLEISYGKFISYFFLFESLYQRWTQLKGMLSIKCQSKIVFYYIQNYDTKYLKKIEKNKKIINYKVKNCYIKRFHEDWELRVKKRRLKPIVTDHSFDRD